jgi:hypothetical protein
MSWDPINMVPVHTITFSFSKIMFKCSVSVFLDDLVSKLSAKCQEVHISCRDHLLCIKLCPRTSILRNSLNSNVISTHLVMKCDIIKHSFGSFHPNSNFFVAEKIEMSDFFTVCSLYINHALCKISDF